MHYPKRQIFARAKPNCGKQTHGVSHGLPRRSPSGRRRARPLVRLVRLVRQVRRKRHAHATRTPPLPSSCLAYPRGKSARCITPAVNLRPSHSTLRHCKPSGYTGACHGVARQGEDGRTNLSDRSDRSDISATPPRPANRRCYQTGIPLRHIITRAIPNSGMQTHGVYNGAPIILL